jgi:hypothetical protein
MAERMDAGWQAARHWEAECETARAERDALQAQLAALKKRVADAPRKMLYPRDESEKTKWVAVLDLEDGE